MNNSIHEFQQHIIKTFGLDGRRIRKLMLVMEANTAPVLTLEEYAGFDETVETKVFHFTEDETEETQTPQR